MSTQWLLCGDQFHDGGRVPEEVAKRAQNDFFVKLVKGKRTI